MPGTTQGGNTHAASILPMEMQIGGRFTDQGEEWEVVTHPAAMHGGVTAGAAGYGAAPTQWRAVQMAAWVAVGHDGAGGSA